MKKFNLEIRDFVEETKEIIECEANNLHEAAIKSFRKYVADELMEWTKIIGEMKNTKNIDEINDILEDHDIYIDDMEVKTFNISLAVPVFMEIEIEATNKTDALDKMYNEIKLSSYAGNFGFDKIIGTESKNVSLYVSEELEPLENKTFKIEIEEK